jgi:hypothetical protein
VSSSDKNFSGCSLRFPFPLAVPLFEQLYCRQHVFMTFVKTTKTRSCYIFCPSIPVRPFHASSTGYRVNHIIHCEPQLLRFAARRRPLPFSSLIKLASVVFNIHNARLRRRELSTMPHRELPQSDVRQPLLGPTSEKYEAVLPDRTGSTTLDEFPMRMSRCPLP